MIEKTVVISDVHGCIDEFSEMLNLVDAKSPYVRIICLGDFLDRGPDSVGCIRKARELDLECVMGNHEHKFIKWFRSMGTKNDVYDRHDYYSKFSDEDINYISRMSQYISLPEQNTVVVHAGLRAGVSLENQKKDDLYYIRYMDSNSKFISLKKISKLGKAAVDAHFWTEYWAGPQSVVYGHNVHSYEDALVEEVSPGVFCYGLDTGACFGGKLTALILESKEIIQIKAKKEYYKSDFTIR